LLRGPANHMLGCGFDSQSTHRFFSFSSFLSFFSRKLIDTSAFCLVASPSLQISTTTITTTATLAPLLPRPVDRQGVDHSPRAAPERRCCLHPPGHSERFIATCKRVHDSCRLWADPSSDEPRRPLVHFFAPNEYIVNDLIRQLIKASQLASLPAQFHPPMIAPVKIINAITEITQMVRKHTLL
jgi:hypothetical protein